MTVSPVVRPGDGRGTVDVEGSASEATPLIAMPSAFVILSLLLAQDASASHLQATWPAEFYAGATGSHFSQGESYAGWQGSGGASATLYLGRPLVNDGTPLVMQSYLQRLSRLHLSGGGTATSGSDSASPYRYTSQSAYVSPSGFFYLSDLILGAGAYYYRLASDTQPADLSPAQHHTTQLIYPWASVGLRADSLELYATYQFRTFFDDGSRRPPTWGQASVRLRNMLENAFYWRLDGYTLTGGGGGAFDIEVFFEPTLGLWLDGYFETGQIYASGTSAYTRRGGEIGVGWWASPRFELQFSLAVSSASRNDGNYLATTSVGATFGVVLRAPQHDRAQPAGAPLPLLVRPPLPPPPPSLPPAAPPVSPVETPPQAEPPAPSAPPADLPAPDLPADD
jgi:hypothetical protein